METITAQVIDQQTLLQHWLGHRRLTRRVIDSFSEKDLFEFSIGGMRTFAKLAEELLAIGAPGLTSILKNEEKPYGEGLPELTSKEQILQQWDEQTAIIENYFNQLPIERFSESFKLFGQYEAPIVHNILYFIDNEIHHRGQGYVYLRALGVEPPMFWER